MDAKAQRTLITQILRLSCFFLFLGRGWQHLFGETPYPSQLMAQGLGVFYVLMSIGVTVWEGRHRYGHILLWLSSVSLILLSFLYFQNKNYEPPQFFEYASQVLSPIFLATALFTPIRLSSSGFLRAVQVAVALTFFSHGLYALDVFPRPASFVNMTMLSLGVGGPFAEGFLLTAGILDMIVTIGIFSGNYSRVFILWCIIWGLFTALARTYAFVEFSPEWGSALFQRLPDTLYRMPHTLIPLLLLVIQFPDGGIARRLRGK